MKTTGIRLAGLFLRAEYILRIYLIEEIKDMEKTMNKVLVDIEYSDYFRDNWTDKESGKVFLFQDPQFLELDFETLEEEFASFDGLEF